MRIALATALAVLATAPAAAAEQRTLSLLSDGAPVSGGEGFAEAWDVSDDGSRVFIVSNERLAAGDTDSANDVYLRTPAGAFVLLSDKAIGPDAEVDVLFAEASADGAVTAFATTERLATTDTDEEWDVYTASAEGALVHISDDPTGADDEDPADFRAMSRDGTSVVFHTRERLAPTDDDDEIDVYRSTPAGLIHVSDDPTGPELNNPAYIEGASGTHDRVFFRTPESLAGTDGDNAMDVYELGPAGLRHLTDDPTGPDAMTDVEFGGATPDGSRVYFRTRESLADSDDDTATDVYERSDGGLRHVSDDPTGADDPLDAAFAHASPDGSRVYFTTRENLAATDTDAREDVYELGGSLVHASRNELGGEGNVDALFWGASADGTRIYIQTMERLAASDADDSQDAYEYGPDGLRHVSDGPGPDAELGAWFHSARAGRVLFESFEPLAPGDTDGESDVYERTPSGALIAVSDGDNGPDIQVNAHVGAVSADGTKVFLDAFDRLLPADGNDYRDVYLSSLVPAPPPPPAGDAPAGDVTPPRISRVRVVRGRLRFTLSEPADVKVVVRRGRTLRLAGRPAGANRVRLRVRRGRHRATITAVDVAGNRSAAKRIRFRAR